MQMRRLDCDFVVHEPKRQVSLRRGPYIHWYDATDCIVCYKPTRKVNEQDQESPQLYTADHPQHHWAA